ncbi:MAG: 2-dehydropantoate 2-reductase [Kouleothrix sp.]|jgi:2-dehydropantoate 2-reductase|nr:2-dehydropantoate 2-reductase [Kouleothrix sp.]
MKIGIIGAGAMGSLLGFYLCEHAEVWLLDPWQAHVAAINAHGLQCELAGALATRYPHATTDAAAIGPCDAVLVLVKAGQTAWAAEQARTLLRPAGQAASAFWPGTLVVTLQNGVGNRELLAAALGADRVGQGVTALGATLLGPGRVRHAGQGATVFGATPSHAAMQALAGLFAESGLPAELSGDLEALVWGKLVVNVGINALTALLRVPNAALADSAEARELLAAAVAEAVAVAHARGTALPYADPLAHVLAVARATGANRSSMLQDALRGSPSEIATINGAVVREGARLGLPTPVNQALTLLVQALDATATARVQS